MTAINNKIKSKTVFVFTLNEIQNQFMNITPSCDPNIHKYSSKYPQQKYCIYSTCKKYLLL